MAEGHIHWISGPVLRARSTDLFHVQDAISVGPSALLGEIVQHTLEGGLDKVSDHGQRRPAAGSNGSKGTQVKDAMRACEELPLNPL